MIYDEVANINGYFGLSENLDQAIRFIGQTDLHKLPLGKTEVNGQRVVAYVMEVELKQPQQMVYEFHRYHLDIHLDLSGQEVIYIGQKRILTHDFSEVDDFGTAQCDQKIICPMRPDNFLICQIDEPHLPGVIATPAVKKIKKCVIKVEKMNH